MEFSVAEQGADSDKNKVWFRNPSLDCCVLHVRSKNSMNTTSNTGKFT